MVLGVSESSDIDYEVCFWKQLIGKNKVVDCFFRLWTIYEIGKNGDFIEWMCDIKFKSGNIEVVVILLEMQNADTNFICK